MVGGVMKMLMMFVTSMLLISVGAVFAEDKSLLEPVKSVFVDNVWSGAPVGFQYRVHGGKQYVAYYDGNRQMTIACRPLDSDKWTYQKFDEFVGWDSHNYVTFAFDNAGYIHLSGNMHCAPLKYFRTTKPEDITSFVRVPSMVGTDEKRVTYPKFIKGPNGEFLFSYRDGGSGNGNEIVDVYDETHEKWSRYVHKPLFEGLGLMNAYFTGPAKDRHGLYHFAWVWRDDPDCSTNHDVSYARSSGYNTGFTKSDGTAVELPLSVKNTEIVDPVPVKAGLLNNIRLTFDSRDRVMITYMKFDKDGNSQIYTARREEKGWVIYRTTDWKDRWDLHGTGSIPVMINYDGPSPCTDGKLAQTFTNKFISPKTMVRFLDEKTMRQIGEPVPLLPKGFDEPAAKHTDDWNVNIRGVGLGPLRKPGTIWVLKWESAGVNRDHPRETIPPPSRLELVEMGLRRTD